MNNRPELGVALTKCFYCQEDDKILLSRRLSKHAADKVNAMNGMAVDMEPCPTCRGYMEQGIIVISIDSEKSKGDMRNPYRMGFWGVMTEEAVSRLITDKEMLESVLKRRMMWLDHQVAIDCGLVAMAADMEADKELSANQRIV